MYMHMVGGDGCEQTLEHSQLDAIVWDVITAAEQLHSLRLQWDRQPREIFKDPSGHMAAGQLDAGASHPHAAAWRSPHAGRLQVQLHCLTSNWMNCPQSQQQRPFLGFHFSAHRIG